MVDKAPRVCRCARCKAVVGLSNINDCAKEARNVLIVARRKKQSLVGKFCRFDRRHSASSSSNSAMDCKGRGRTFVGVRGSFPHLQPLSLTHGCLLGEYYMTKPLDQAYLAATRSWFECIQPRIPTLQKQESLTVS